MDRESLFDAWEADAGRGLQNKDRPAFVREYRDDLAEHADVGDELPPEDASIAEYRDFLERYKGTITRQLNDDADGSDPHDAESDTDAAVEGES